MSVVCASSGRRKASPCPRLRLRQSPSRWTAEEEPLLVVAVVVVEGKPAQWWPWWCGRGGGVFRPSCLSAGGSGMGEISEARDKRRERRRKVDETESPRVFGSNSCEYRKHSRSGKRILSLPLSPFLFRQSLRAAAAFVVGAFLLVWWPPPFANGHLRAARRYSLCF